MGHTDESGPAPSLCQFISTESTAQPCESSAGPGTQYSENTLQSCLQVTIRHTGRWPCTGPSSLSVGTWPGKRAAPCHSRKLRPVGPHRRTAWGGGPGLLTVSTARPIFLPTAEAQPLPCPPGLSCTLCHSTSPAVACVCSPAPPAGACLWLLEGVTRVTCGQRPHSHPGLSHCPPALSCGPSPSGGLGSLWAASLTPGPSVSTEACHFRGLSHRWLAGCSWVNVPPCTRHRHELLGPAPCG